MTPTKPSLDLLRSLSDEHVLRALIERRRATRAEIAAMTGLSKPTVSESVRRLAEAGAVVDTGQRTTGRGRVGTYYALAPTTGRALVASIAPEGITAEAVDIYGDVVARAQAPALRSPEVASTLDAIAREIAGGPFRLAVVSAADPVDRATGRLVELPDAPFLLGALDPPAVLADLVDGPVSVDNDVNWAGPAPPPPRPPWPTWWTAQSASTPPPTGPPAPNTAPTTSSTSTSAKASAPPSSATARSAAATPAWPVRSPTSSPSDRPAPPCGS